MSSLAVLASGQQWEDRGREKKTLCCVFHKRLCFMGNSQSVLSLWTWIVVYMRYRKNYNQLTIDSWDVNGQCHGLAWWWGGGWAGVGGWSLVGRGLVSGFEPIKKKSARQLSGCRKAHLVGFHGPRLLSPAFPGATRKTQASAGLPVTHSHAWTHTHIHIHAEAHRYTLPLSFLPDYKRIILTHSMHSQTCNIMWEHWTVQKITITSAYI